MRTLNLGRVRGNSVHIKYNDKPNDVGACDVWKTGMDYIGFALGDINNKPDTGYAWSKFVGDATTSYVFISEAGNDVY